MKNTILLLPVESSQIAAIGYSPETKTMAVQFFRKGVPASVYHYANVEPHHFETFQKADSMGKHFGATFKSNDAFPCVKCDPDTEEGTKA